MPIVDVMTAVGCWGSCRVGGVGAIAMLEIYRGDAGKVVLRCCCINRII